MNTILKNLVRKILPRFVYPHIVLGGPLRGAILVTSLHDYPGAILGTTERPLLAWFEENVKTGETWIDVGAHYGYTALALSRIVGKNGRVFAFEPMLSTAGYLQRTRKLNKVVQLTVMAMALGAPGQTCISDLTTTRGMIDSTLPQSAWTESFFLTWFDWIWPKICRNNEHIDGIKIDVQGMELDTLRGMHDLLLVQRPKLVIEFHSGVDRQEILAFLESVNYTNEALPIEPVKDEVSPKLLDNRSYAFYSV